MSRQGHISWAMAAALALVPLTGGKGSGQAPPAILVSPSSGVGGGPAGLPGVLGTAFSPFMPAAAAPVSVRPGALLGLPRVAAMEDGVVLVPGAAVDKVRFMPGAPSARAAVLLPVAALPPVASPATSLATAYQLTPDRLAADSNQGSRLGDEIGQAVIAYQRTLDQYTQQELTNTRRVIQGKMLEPQIYLRVRIIEVDRSHFTDVGSVLTYASRNPTTKTGLSYFGKPQNVTYSGKFPADLVAVNGNGVVINLTTEHIDEIITAIQRDFRSDTVAAPSIVALNDNTVHLFAGTNVPFIYGRGATLVQTERMQQAAYKDVGLHLEVTPHVLNRFEVEQTFDFTSEGRALRAKFGGDGRAAEFVAERTRLIENIMADQPIILTIGYRIGTPETATATIKISQKDDLTTVALTGEVQVENAVRASTTRVRLNNARGLVIGGIINELATDREDKVPVLGDLPLVGNAFRRKMREREKAETLIFLEAHIVSPAGEALANDFEYANRHLPNSAPSCAPRPPFSRVPLAPLEGHDYVTHNPGECKEEFLRPVTTAVEVLK